MSGPQRRRRSANTVSLGSHVRSYLDNSTLHGLSYIGKGSLSLVERLFFVGTFAMVCLCAAYFIAIVYDKWSASPVILTLSGRATGVTSISFPAVTICNMNQARRSVVETFANNSVEAQLLRAVCRRDPNMSSSDSGTSNQTEWSVFRGFLLRVSHTCRDMLLYCWYGRRKYRCGHLFRTVLTDEGLCCTFNGVDKRYLLWNGDNDTEFELIDPDDKPPFTPIDYTYERGFPADADPWSTFPRRAYGAGKNLGLTLLADVHSSEYFCSSTNSAGLKMLLHSPNEIPRIADYGINVAAGRESLVIVKPDITEASPLLRPIAVRQRRCVFAEELRLEYYRIYTRKNCKLECVARLEVQQCGCHQYYMPRVLRTVMVGGVLTEVRICTREEHQCLNEVRLAVASPQNATFRCNCLPACFDIHYGMRITSTEIGSDFKVQMAELNLVNRSYMEKNYAVVHVFYKKKEFQGTMIKPFVGFTDFLSNIGGLLSLFMGFSFISIFELLYYLTIRPYCEQWRRKTRRTVSDRWKTPATWWQLRQTWKRTLRSRLIAKRARMRVIRVYPYTE